MATVTDIWKRAQTVLSIDEPAPRAYAEAALSDASNSNNVIQAGDFRIDADSRSATVRGHELHLNGAEFDVLVFLTSHRKRIITSHTRLATKSDDRGVHQAEFLPALLSLRRKLHEEVPGVPYISTEAWILFEFQPGVDVR